MRNSGLLGTLTATVALGVTSVVAVLVAPQTAAAATVVVADYEMNESAGATVMNDSGPNNIDGRIGSRIAPGTLVNGATAYRFAPVGTPAGEPVDDERLALVDHNSNLNPDSVDFAIEFRYRTTRSFGNVVQKGQNGTAGGYFKFEQPSGLMTCLFKDKNGLQRSVKSNIATNDGQWHTIRCEKNTTFIKLFVDGTQVAIISHTLANIANTRPLSIGGKENCDQISTTCDYFDGDIDYVKLEKAPGANQPPIMKATGSCVDLTCTFDSAGSNDPDTGGKIVSRSWDFGDGSAAQTGPTAQHTYAQGGTYDVTLTGTDDSGATDSVTIQVTAVGPNAAPTMSFTSSCNQLTCTFDSSASSDSDGSIASRTWTFGDLGTGSGTTVTHTYAAGGTYTVALTGTDNKGAETTEITSVTVTESVVLPPIKGATRFVPLTPQRVFDTRPGEKAPGTKGVVAGGKTLTVDVTGVAGVPATGVAAVAINLTVVGIGAPSFVTAWATGTTRPNASTLNIVSAGQVRANLAVVPVGSDGTISLYTKADAHLLGDIAGYYTSQTSATRAGRTIVQSPQRLFDTRPNADPGPKGFVAARSTVTVPVRGKAGVPTSGAAAVVLNVTATGNAGRGFVTVWDTGDIPTASVINLNNAGESVPNMVIVPIGSDGSIRLSPSVGTHLLADVLGYVTSSSAVSSASGLFVPMAPTRVFDTRPEETTSPGPKGLIPAKKSIRPEIAGAVGIPNTAGAVLLNLTMVGTAPGYATLFPAGADRPTTSNVNVNGAGDVRPNGAMVALGDGGDLDAYVLTPAHLLADVAGWFIS